MTDNVYEFLTDGDNPDWKVEFEPNHSDENDPEELAEEAAYHYYSECDGWESRWPIKFEVFCNGKSLGKFLVELEYDPCFSARSINDN